MKAIKYSSKIVELQFTKSSSVIQSDRLIVRNSSSIHIIPYREITHISADGNYCRVFLVENKSLLLSRTLKSIQDQINPTRFKRIHQSHLINLEFLRQIKSNLQVELSTGIVLPYSRRKKNDLIQAVIN